MKSFVLPLAFLAMSSSVMAAPASSIGQWAQANAVQLKSLEEGTDFKAFEQVLGEKLKTAAVVGLGESGHAVREAATARLRLLEFLVKVHGFRAIALESGMFEGQLVNRYVHGQESDINKALVYGFTHNMGVWEESKELIEWVRDYNSKQTLESEKISFYGIDLPGLQDSMIDHDLSAIDTPLEQALGYLKKVDPSAHADFGVRLEKIARKASVVYGDLFAAFPVLTVNYHLDGKDYPLRYIDPDLLDDLSSINYRNLTSGEMKELAFLLSELVSTLSLRKRYFLDVNSNLMEYEMALRMAELSQDILKNLQFRERTPVMPNIDKIKLFFSKIYSHERLEQLRIADARFDGTQEEFDRFFENRNGRENALFNGVKWIVGQKKKVLLYAHNSHLSKTGYVTPDIADPRGLALGNYLDWWYGDRYIMIGQTMDRFVDESGQEITSPSIVKTEAVPDSLEYTLRQVPGDTFMLDLSKDAPAQLGQLMPSRFETYFYRVSPSKAFDFLLFIRDLQNGRPLISGSH
jgi:erythromycin esterase-like protein